VSPATAGPEVPSPARPARLSAGAKITLGLFLTLGGLFLLGATIPSAPATLYRAIAVTGAGALAVWLGGILLGGRGRR